MHLNRLGIKYSCDVCGVAALEACVQATPREPEPSAEETLHFEMACLEYQIIGGVQRLRALKPDHILVKTIDAVLKYRESEQARQ